MAAIPMDALHNADEIVITGAGLATSLGSDRWTTWRNVLAGHCGIRPLTALESNGPQPRTGGEAIELPDVDISSTRHAGEPREIGYLKHVVHTALQDARLLTGQSNLHPQYEPTRCAVIMGTTLHGMRNGGAFLRSGRFEHLGDFLANRTLQRAVDDPAIGGPRITTCSACSSGLASIILGVRMLQNREVDLVAVGGYDPISEYAYAGFRSMRLESEGGVRPFSRHRDGMKVAEGYACLILERAGCALRRDAKVLARIVGYGEACDAFHLSKPHPQGDGAASAMRMALSRSGIDVGQIDLIVAHATGTRENDAAEYAAIQQVFGESISRIPTTAFKGHLGHTLGGAGAVELVLSLMTLNEGVVPPCVGDDPADLEFKLRLQTGSPLRRELRHTLNLSLGFGGANACIIMGAPSTCSTFLDRPEGTTSPSPSRTTPSTSEITSEESEARSTSNIRAASRTLPEASNREVFITGVGVVLPGAVGNEAFLQRLQMRTKRFDAGLPTDLSDEDIAPLVNAQRARRMSRYGKLCIASTTAAFQDARITDLGEFGARCAVYVASLHGPAEFSEVYYRQIINEGLEAANPSLFAEGVPNVGSAHLSTHFGITGFCQSIIGSRTASLDALRLAATSIQTGAWDRAVVCASDEITPLVSETYDRLGNSSPSGNGASPRAAAFGVEATRQSSSTPLGVGAVCLILESASAAKKRGARPRGIITKTVGVSWPARSNNRSAIQRIAYLLEEVESTGGLLVSTSGAHWSDRLVRAGLKEWSRRREGKHERPPIPAISSIYGYFPDVLSALPLADLAAVLLSGRLPSNAFPFVNELRGCHGVHENQKINEVSLLAADPATSASGARVRLIPSR